MVGVLRLIGEERVHDGAAGSSEKRPCRKVAETTSDRDDELPYKKS